MAGPCSEYFQRSVAPLIDGREVEYVGPVSGADRAELLGSAGVLLSPLQAAEPFSLVLAEAMMCGTPAVATTVGATSEVIEPGVTGYCAAGREELPDLVHAALDLDRAAVRARAEMRFTASRMVDEYLAVYEKVVAG
jgi:glycosyltransferase involved in cell wall biosynthesis